MKNAVISLSVCLALSLNIYAMEKLKESFPFAKITEELKPYILEMGMDSLVKSSSTIDEVFGRATSHIKAIRLTNQFFKSQRNKLIKQCRNSLREKIGPEIPRSKEELLKLLGKDDKAFGEYILLGFDPNYCFKTFGPESTHTKPLIFYALEKNNITLIKLLIMFGVNLDLAEVVKFYDSLEMINQYQTPLMFCCKKGYEEIGKLLIRHCAELNLTDYCGRTALSLAVGSGSLGLVEMLMEYNADPNLKDIYGHKPVYYACKKLSSIEMEDEIGDWEEDLELVEKRNRDLEKYKTIRDKILQYALTYKFAANFTSAKPKVNATLAIKKCQNCGTLQTRENALLRCGKCRKVYYCNVECQKKDWPNHKHICKK